MAKDDLRAELERLTASFRGAVTVCPPKQRPTVKQRRKGKRAPEPVLPATSIGEPQPIVDHHGVFGRYREADAYFGDAPCDLRHHAPRMRRKPQGAAYDENEERPGWFSVGDTGAMTNDEKRRARELRRSAKTGECCGACSRKLEPDEPVWLYWGIIYGRVSHDCESTDYGEDQELVVPICATCWDALDHHPRISTKGPCIGCGRRVSVTVGALKSWLARGKRIACSDACLERPPSHKLVCQGCGKEFVAQRSDARTCSDACRKSAQRKKMFRSNIRGHGIGNVTDNTPKSMAFPL